jgi:drug/metabolite transporter (DMT)-like permease
MSGIFFHRAEQNSATCIAFRTALALPILVPWAYVEFRRHGRLPRVEVLRQLVCGVFLGIDFALYVAALPLVGVGVATVLVNVHVMVVPILDRIFRKRQVDKALLVCGPVICLGIVLIADVRFTAPLGAVGQGAALALAAGVAYGGFVFVAHTAPPSPLIAMRTLTNTAGAGVAGVAFGLVFGAVNLNPGAAGLGWIFLSTITSQVLAAVLLMTALNRINPAAGASLMLVTPIVGLALGVALLGERLVLAQIIGVLMTMTAIVVLARRRETAAPSDGSQQE